MGFISEFLIDGLHSFPKKVIKLAAMLVVLTKKANKISFIKDHQHGGDDVTY